MRAYRLNLNGNRVSAYYDKHGELIKSGMTLRHDNGDTGVVSGTVSSFDGKKDLEMSCNALEAYPLWEFDLREWEIAKDEDD